jgi:hypothetical protein
MTRLSRILWISALSLGAAACGDYDDKSYEANNAAYEEQDNAAYDAGEGANQAYDTSTNNAAYAPPADANMSNVSGEDPTGNVTNSY